MSDESTYANTIFNGLTSGGGDNSPTVTTSTVTTEYGVDGYLYDVNGNQVAGVAPFRYDVDGCEYD